MLSALRNRTGGPSVRARILALLVVVGLLVLTAPLVLVPLIRALVNGLYGRLVR